MAEAKRPGGLYYMGDDAVDAEGRKIEDAPKRPADTPREKQPGAIGVADPQATFAKALVHELVGAGALKGTVATPTKSETKVAPLPAPPAGATVVKPSAADRAPGTPTAGAPQALAAATEQSSGSSTAGTTEGSERRSARKGGARKSARKSAGK